MEKHAVQDERGKNRHVHRVSGLLEVDHEHTGRNLHHDGGYTSEELQLSRSEMTQAY